MKKKYKFFICILFINSLNQEILANKKIYNDSEIDIKYEIFNKKEIRENKELQNKFNLFFKLLANDLKDNFYKSNSKTNNLEIISDTQKNDGNIF